MKGVRCQVPGVRGGIKPETRNPKPETRFSKLLAPLLISFSIFLSSPVLAVTSDGTQTLLTQELLQERLDSPVQSEGFSTIDLRNLIIDLTGAEFRDRFYQQVQAKINRSKEPLGLDLGSSRIEGELIASRLGLQTPLTQVALSSLLTTDEQEQLKRDRRLFKSDRPIPRVTVFRGPLKLNGSRVTGTANFAETFFLRRLEASEATFEETVWEQARLSRTADFSGAVFNRKVNFSRCAFFGRARLEQVQFQEGADFRGSTFFESANFAQAQFAQLADFTGTLWYGLADFSQTLWQDRALLSQSHFLSSLDLTSATLTGATAFRGTIFEASIHLREVKLLEQIDFSNAVFAPGVRLNVAGLAFDSETAKILGDTGAVGEVIALPTLKGNETVLRNLVRNFRSLEQISDANQIEYTAQSLRQQQLSRSIVSPAQGFNFNWVRTTLTWLGLSLLLLLSNYGTSFGLIFGIGIIAVAYFGLLFWVIDRWRRRLPTPILPSRYETTCMLSSAAVLMLIGITDIFGQTSQPWLAIACLGGVLLPVPLLLVGYLYWRGRYHNLLDVTYFVEDGSARQLRLLIVRLPIMPRFPFFRDRYEPILWNRRWNWLNYYDLSINNLLKLGFNDIRLRDQHLPGIISTLVWYQWSLGILYVALLLWTISRTIPGLNLLIYLK